ncbi:putative low-specificity L-threonine aldolase 2-like protein, partial [Leptotrombidium deliense]
MFGKEAALYVPTGTMGNLAAIMAHCWNRGEEIIVGDLSHIHQFEQGGIAQLGHIHSRTVKNNEDGTFCLLELESKIRKKYEQHFPISTLVCIENTHNWCNGSPLDFDFISDVCRVSKSYNLKVHVDGARIFNASVKQQIPVAKLVENCDSISVCLSKGLCCPIGSLVIGEKQFIQRVHRCRKVLGGGMRQVGHMAATGIVALKTMVNRLADDHKHAEMIAKAFNSYGNGFVKIDPKLVKTNILFVETDPQVITAHQYTALLRQPSEINGEKVVIKANAISDSKFRVVTNANVSEDDVLVMVDKIKQINEKIAK